MCNSKSSPLSYNQVSAEIVSNAAAMPKVNLIWLEAPDIASTARPGQFVMAKCSDDNLLRRPFSIHRVSDDGNNLALLINKVGKGTRWLSERKSSDTIDLLGPLGNGFTINPSSRRLLLVAGGIGIAPLGFVADTTIRQGKEVILLNGATTGEYLYPSHLIPPNVKHITATDDGSSGHCGFITDIIPQFIGSADQVFACGPSPMFRTMANMPELKDKPVQVSLEVRMGCGFGVCYGCTVKTKHGLKQVCNDGPVFNLEDVLWNELADI